MSRAPRTAAVHSGLATDTQFGSVVPPLHLSSNFTFAGLGRARAHDYTRSGNPTRDLLGDALAELEGGVGGVITASGMAAVTTLLHTVPAGGRIVAPSDAYGGTFRLLRAMEERGAFQVDLVELWRSEAVEAACSTPLDMLWIETPSNPLLRITDLDHAVRSGHAAGARVVVDNTFLSPALQRPLGFGADWVVHSTTKYVNGHSDVVGGAIVSREASGHEEAAWWSNCLGVTGAPHDAWLTSRGLRTLDLRMRAHLEGATAVVGELRRHDVVAAIHWPGLETHPGYQVAARQQDGAGAMLSAEFHGGKASVRAFVEGLGLFLLAESLGGVESLVAHPATMTHLSMTPEARAEAGIGNGLVRFSVGIEDPSDLVADIRAACLRAERAACSSAA
jgi:cystathionine gamma-synthase